MTKIRVHEYAKKVNRTSKEVIDELEKNNVSVSNHMATLDTESISKLDRKFGGQKTGQTAPAASTSKPSNGQTNNQQGTQQRSTQRPQNTNRPAQSGQGGNRPAQGGQSRPAQSGQGG